MLSVMSLNDYHHGSVNDMLFKCNRILLKSVWNFPIAFPVILPRMLGGRGGGGCTDGSLGFLNGDSL